MNNTLLQKNLHLFSKRFEELHKALIALPTHNTLPTGLQLITAKNNDVSATFENAYLHSAYNPSSEAKKHMQNSDICSADSIVFLGIGLGYGPIECAKLHKNKTIIIIETDPYRILLSFSLLDWEDVFTHSSLVFLIEAPQQTVITILEHYGLNECFFIAQKSIMQHNIQYFTNIQTLISRNLDKQKINMRTLEKFSTLWLSNMCKNLSTIEKLDGILRYKDKIENIPACVVAAGPSLDDILPFLHEIKKRCILICVDTALRACLSIGVEPHFIILVDPQYWNARHIEGLQSPKSILITEAAAYPSVFRFKCKEILLCSSLFPLGKYVENLTGEKGELAAGGSVATTAWDFARFIGCKEIYMAGLDLSYPDKKTHTKGSTFEEKSHIDSVKIHPSETALAKVLYNPYTERSRDFEGKETITDSRMKLYAWWFESKYAAHPHITTYSLSKSSLAIPLMSITTIESLMKTQKHTQRIIEFIENTTQHKAKHSHLNIIDSLLKDFSTLQKIVHDGIELCKEICKTDKDYEKLLHKLTLVDVSISESSAKNIVSLVFPTPSQFEKIIHEKLSSEPPMPPDGTYAMHAQYNIAKTSILYKLIKKSIEFHIRYLRKNT